MATAWLTYAWADNDEGDVDYVAQELVRAGLAIKLDRWNLKAGSRLWEQIADHITNPNQCDAWLFYATQQSLGSEACKEEFAYALDRALSTRGNTFPIIAIFPNTVETALLPPGIRTRLCISITDLDWKERALAAAEGRAPSIPQQDIHPYFIKVHSTPSAHKPFFIEMRPRAGVWSPFAVAIPITEKDTVNPNLAFGPKGVIPMGVLLFQSGAGKSDDGDWWIQYAANEASPTQSCFLACQQLPSEIAFGTKDGQLYRVGIPREYVPNGNYA